MTIASSLLELFGEGHSNYAVGSFDGQAVAYRPVDTPLTEQLVEQHLAGEIILGCYQLLPNSTVQWLAWDVDSRDTPLARSYTQQITSFLTSQQVPHAVEWSGSKGYHIFLFFQQPIPASQAKLITDSVRKRFGLPATGPDHVECFPKQEALTPTSPYGNLMKLPLGEHPVTRDRSRFVRIGGDWGELPAEETLRLRVTPEQVARLVQAGSANDLVEQVGNLFTGLWTEGERHNLALGLSGYLANSGWRLEQARQVMEEICRAAGDTDIGNRLACVEDTYLSIAEGKEVAGASLLLKMLSPQAMASLTSMVGQGASTNTVLQLDSIRTTGKAPSFLRVRSSSRFIMNNLAELGTPIQTPDGEIFWYRDEDHRILETIGPEWDSQMLSLFGLNTKEAFAVLVQHELMTKFHDEAEIVQVHRRSSWDAENGRLYVHLDGEEVYVLDGISISIAYNGDVGLMFQSLSLDPVVLNPSLPSTVDAWEHLVNDLSFEESSDAPASPEQQQELLKAWILSFFFPEIMPTRPILCCLGSPGSGKTSAMRRILWVLENPNADVLEPIGDKPDALRASLSAHKFLVLDNLEKTKVHGLADVLNRVATGSEIEQRQLYTTNTVHHTHPNLYVALTAVNLPFTEETLFTRLLPLEMQQLAHPLPENMVQGKIKDNRADIWLSLLHYLNQVVAAILANPSPQMSSSSRLADFTSFCSQLEGAGNAVNYPKLAEGIGSLLKHQEYILQQASPLTDLLSLWIRTHPAESCQPHSAGELTAILSPIAKYSKIRWLWNGPAALERHMTSLQETLQRDYGAIIGRRTIEGGRTETTYSFGASGPTPS